MKQTKINDITINSPFEDCMDVVQPARVCMPSMRMTVEEAERFIADMQKAVEIAKTLPVV